MTTVIALLGRAAAEALFYTLVAGWYLLCVQWDVVDVLLGGPDLNKVTFGKVLLISWWYHLDRAELMQGGCILLTRASGCDR